MVDTTFINENTIIEEDWMNDVNDHTYNGPSVTEAHAAEIISVEDSQLFFDATTVEAALAEIKTKPFTNKADAITHTPVVGAMYFIGGTDGGWFKGISGTGLADNGAAYCGTLFIPTGGDGTVGWVRVDGGYNAGLPYLSVWFGTITQTILQTLTTYAKVTFDGETIETTGLTFANKCEWDLNGATIKQADLTSISILLNINSSDAVTLKNGTIDGNRANNTAVEQNGFWLYSDNITLDNVEVINVYGSAIRGTDPSNLTIQDCEIDNCQKIGMLIQNSTAASDNIKILRNKVTFRTADSGEFFFGIQVWGSPTYQTTNVWIQGNQIEREYHAVHISQNGIETKHITSGAISYNTSKKSAIGVSCVGECEGISIVGNIIELSSLSTGSGIEIGGQVSPTQLATAKGVTATGNTITGYDSSTWVGYGIIFDTSGNCGASVSGNHIRHVDRGYLAVTTLPGDRLNNISISGGTCEATIPFYMVDVDDVSIEGVLATYDTQLFQYETSSGISLSNITTKKKDATVRSVIGRLYARSTYKFDNLHINGLWYDRGDGVTGLNIMFMDAVGFGTVGEDITISNTGPGFEVARAIDGDPDLTTAFLTCRAYPISPNFSGAFDNYQLGSTIHTHTGDSQNGLWDKKTAGATGWVKL